MALEHRWSQRQQIHWKGFVFHRQPGLVAVSLLNIGTQGTLITAPHLTLTRYASVELGFIATRDGKQTIHHIQAYVVHGASNIYGLMFKDFRFEQRTSDADAPGTV